MDIRKYGWIIILCAAVAQAGVTIGDIEFEPCQLPGAMREGLCGTYTVYEHRTAQTGRTIDLKIVIYKATGDTPKPDPIFYFTGGPGQGAASVAGMYSRMGMAFNQDRDLVLIDQRGTGESNGLFCKPEGPTDSLQTYLNGFFEDAYVQKCLDELSKRADLKLYTTDLAMDDYDEIRAALGYEQINLSGGSYGTRSAMVYMRRHPDTVRSAILFGTAPTFYAIPSEFAQDAQIAFDRLVADCAQDDACSKEYPTLREDLNTCLAQLKQGPVTTKAFNPVRGQEEEIKLSHDMFITAVRATLYNVQMSSRLPAMLRLCAEGDWSTMGSYAGMYMKSISEAVADGMYLSVTCAEDLPYFDHAAAAKAGADTFLGDFRIRQQANGCKLWPRGPIPENYRDPVATDHPVLIVSGEVDPVTPPRWGEMVAKHFPNGRHLVLPNTGHGGNGWMCVTGVYKNFFDSGAVEDLDVDCAAKIQRPPFVALAGFQAEIKQQLEAAASSEGE